MIKFLFRLILLAIVLLGLGVVFAPNLAATKWGKSVFLKIYKAATGKTLNIETFRISWSKGQELENIILMDRTGKVVFEGKKIVTDATLWQIVFYHNLGNMQMTSPKVVVQAELPKKIAWTHAGFTPTIATSSTMPHYFGHVVVEDGTAQFLSPGFDPITLQEVELDLSLFQSQIKLKGSGKTVQGKIGGHFEVAGMYTSLSNIDLTATLENFPVRSIDQVTALFNPSLRGLVLEAIGDAMNIQLKVKNLPKILELYCDASSPSFSAHLETETKDGHVTLAAPASFQLQIPQFRGRLNIDNFSLPLSDKESFSLQATLKSEVLGRLKPFTLFVVTDNFKDRTFSLKIDSPQVQLNSALSLPHDWNHLVWQGQGLFPANTKIDFSAQMELSPLSIQMQLEPFHLTNIPISGTKLSLSGELKNRKGTFDLTSSIGEGSLVASGSIQNEITAKATLHQVPTALLDFFLPISPLLGATLNGNIDISTPQFSFELSSPVMTAEAVLEKKGNQFQLTKPAHLNFKLTPVGYVALNQWLNLTPSSFVLVEPAQIKSTVSSFQWPNQYYNADLSIDTLAIAPNSRLKEIQLHLEHPNLSLYHFTLNAQSGISLQGNLDLASGAAELKCRLDQFPTDILGNPTMAALFGPQINLTAHSSLTEWSGPVDLQLNSSNIRASLGGVLTQGVLNLNKPLHVQMMVTHALSRTIQPLSLTTLESHDPITLEIPPQGFSYPVIPSNPAQINIPKGRLELGKLYCRNEGNLNITLGLLKLSQYSQNQNLELWFAPLDFQIQNGIMECERTELLVANNYQICSWGEIDFVKSRVDMTLGLTSSCLKKAFGIKDLPENYVLRLPMRGPLNDVKIDTSKATTKIGMLLLWQQKSVALDKGPAGAIAGKFLNKIGPLPDGDSKAPPPKHPFPWEQSPPKKKKISDNRKHIDPDEQPLKQILRLLR